MRGETDGATHARAATPFQSTPLMRGETLSDRKIFPVSPISIHSPHTRGDAEVHANVRLQLISIHSPHTRGDAGGTTAGRGEPFQSTPLMRGETAWSASEQPCKSISIHSPHARGDYSLACSSMISALFQSAPLTRGETKLSYILLTFPSYFNPLPSHEGRHNPV